MKIKFFLLLFLSSYAISAQLIINLGARLSIAGNTQLTLQNTDFINNGIFSAGNSTISFKGNASSFIGGNQPAWFSEIEINKRDNTSVILQQPIGVTKRVVFSSGFLNLNSFNTDLGTNGSLENEQEASRIIGEKGGEVLLSTILNAPVTADPGNLGAVIVTSQNLGNVIIKRGHQKQSGFGLGNSLLRYYDIVPENNVILDEFRINYFDGELNGIDENSLVFFKSDNLIDWSSLAIDSGSVTGNFVSKKNVAPVSRWTLAADNSSVPVHFILFNAKCEDDKTLVTWETAQEQNTSHFNIERSTDGVRWTVIGNLPAARNSSTERSYSFTDNRPVQNAYYRIAQYDLDARVQYTNVIRSSCTIMEKFTLWPNPARDAVFVNIVTGNESQAVLKIFDSKGALV
ncbi:MAG TPA: hypothetical protein VFO37_15160, partial [Chitinophagaceae bacterium]|nr:hypothetical protein [Chitinophagaceae bacterium]